MKSEWVPSLAELLARRPDLVGIGLATVAQEVTA
jgi:hypothetical protein